jgi:hypothetical protein
MAYHLSGTVPSSIPLILLPDTLSRIYVFNVPGTVQTPGEYIAYNINNKFKEMVHLASRPLTMGQDAPWQ